MSPRGRQQYDHDVTLTFWSRCTQKLLHGEHAAISAICRGIVHCYRGEGHCRHLPILQQDLVRVTTCTPSWGFHLLRICRPYAPVAAIRRGIVLFSIFVTGSRVHFGPLAPCSDLLSFYPHPGTAGRQSGGQALRCEVGRAGGRASGQDNQEAGKRYMLAVLCRW